MNFWKYFLIENGINSGIAALSMLASSKIGSPELQAAAQVAIEALHNFLEIWHSEKASLSAK